MVRQNMKILIIMLIAIIAAAGNLYASPVSLVSPQFEATAGQFRSDADFLLNLRGYDNVDFEKWFGVISFHGNPSEFSQTSMAQFGFATRFNEVYTGFYFGGNTWNLQPHEYAERRENFFGDQKTMKSYSALPTIITTYTPRNEAAVLFGFADMGLRLSFASTYRSRSLSEDFKADTDFYKSFVDVHGSLNPELAWGMAKPIMITEDKGIRPHLYINADIFRDYWKQEQYTTASGTSGKRVEKSNNSLTLNVTAAMGGWSLKGDDNFDFGFDLWYGFGMVRYNNEYAYQDGGNYLVGKDFKGTVNGNDFQGKGSMSHSLTPYLYGYYIGEKIILSSELGLGFSYKNNTESVFRFKTGSEALGTLVKDGLDETTTTIGFNPTISLGMQWGIVPDKFFLNAGGSINLGSMNFNTTETLTFVQGEKDSANPLVKEINNTFENASTSLSIGFTFFPAQYISFQAICGVDSITNNVNIFDTNAARGLGVFSKILATVKF